MKRIIAIAMLSVALLVTLAATHPQQVDQFLNSDNPVQTRVVEPR